MSSWATPDRGQIKFYNVWLTTGRTDQSSFRHPHQFEIRYRGYSQKGQVNEKNATRAPWVVVAAACARCLLRLILACRCGESWLDKVELYLS